MKVTSILFLLYSISLCAQTNPDPHRFDEQMAEFRSWDSRNAIPANHVLFVGSSSIRMWKSADMFPGLPIVNRGFGGSHISDMLFFKNEILLTYGAPACIVMYCGDNDIASGKKPDQVIKDFQEWWSLVKANYPKAPLIFIPIKPCPSRWEKWPEANKVNRAVIDMAQKDDLLYYADTATPMLETGEPPAADLFLDDLLHLSDKGYKMWTDVVRSMIDKILAQ